MSLFEAIPILSIIPSSDMLSLKFAMKWIRVGDDIIVYASMI